MTTYTEGIQRIAAQANLSVPQVRYWAELHGALLSIRRTTDGEWQFSSPAIEFLRRIGSHVAISQADASEADASSTASSETAAATELESAASIVKSSESAATSKDAQVGVDASKAAVLQTAVSLAAARHPTALAPRQQLNLDTSALPTGNFDQTFPDSNGLDKRFEELALHMADLAEETKQMQILLSRIIEMLAPIPSPTGRPRVVRAWQPPRV